MELESPFEEKSPALYIQCDWNQALTQIGGQAWISSKYKDEPSIQGMIKTSSITSAGIQVNVTNGFTIEHISPDVLIIRYNKCTHSTIFLAPSTLYPDIHRKSVISLNVTPKGLAVSACSENNLNVWNIKDGVIKRTLVGHEGDVYKCRFFPSGSVVLSCGADMRVKIWSADTGICPVTLTGHSMAVTDIAIVDVGKNIISCSKDGSVKLWNCGAMTCIADILNVSSAINCCKVIDAPPRLTIGEPIGEQSSLEVKTENKLLLVGCEDGFVYCVALKSRKELFSISHPSAINCIGILQEEGCFVVGCQNGVIYKYDLLDSSSPKKTWSESNSAVLALLEFQEGFLDSRADGSTTFRLHNSSKSKSKSVILTGPNFDPVYDLSSDGSNVFTSCRDGTIRKYPLENVIKNYF